MKLSVIIPVYNQQDLVIRALASLPRRDDIEVLVRDDGSTDNTLANVQQYAAEHPELNIKIFANGENKGVAYTKNQLLKDAKGEYFHIHDSDDYVQTDEYGKVIDLLGGADIYCFNLRVNDGTIYHLNEVTQNLYCAQIARFIRKGFAEGLQFPEDVRAGDDGYFAADLMARNPRVVFTGITAYYYNYPREGSLTDLRIKGVLP